MEEIEYLMSKEWWIANKAGGWASSTIIGANTSKYNGLFLIVKNDGERIMLVSTMDEFLTDAFEKYPLSTHFYKDAIYPKGYENLEDFSFESQIARWTYNVKGNRLSKEVWCGVETNQTYIRYTLLEGKGIGISIIPLLSNRNIHSIGARSIKKENVHLSNRLVKILEPKEWYISANRGLISNYNYEYYNFFYKKEFEREEEHIENLYSIIKIDAYLKEGQNLEIVFYSDTTPYLDNEVLYDMKKREIEDVVKKYKKSNIESLIPLLQSCDSYLIKVCKKYGVCAGYPYFWQWARDTFISLPGLCLPFSKYKIFLDIMKNWLEHAKDGILPNRIENIPIYESVDGMLWLLWAAVEFEKEKPLDKKIKKKILEQMEYWFEPNDFFELDRDGLIKLKKPRLTWMDTIIDGKPYTPREGKPIEINALWTYALKNLAKMDENNKRKYFNAYKKAADSMKNYITDKKYLLDNIDPIDLSNRPNQLWAFALLPEVFYKQKNYLKEIRKKLFVPTFGFYSLSPEDEKFVKEYKGNIKDRDKAYHNGAIWPYFIGAYAQAWLELNLEKEEIKKDVDGITKNIYNKGLLHLPEIYDQKTLKADGCVMQSWSVAETIRANILVLENEHKKIKKISKIKIENF
ncbi:MAG: amylo-alpha-1,6-glucosidase [Candidatus Anstonellaceae archaeon]